MLKYWRCLLRRSDKSTIQQCYSAVESDIYFAKRDEFNFKTIPIDATQIAKERAEREKEDQEQADYYSSDEYYYKNNMTRRGEDEPRLQSEKLLL